MPNQAVTPTGRRAALFTEKPRGHNGYYLWFSTISVQAPDAFSKVLPNAWKGPFSLYFEAKAAGRQKFEMHFPRGLWLKVLRGDLKTGTLTRGSAGYWTSRGYKVAPEHMIRHRVIPLGGGWFGFEIRFNWGSFPREWLIGELEPVHHGYVIGYWWLTDDDGRWDHVGEAGKGYYLTEPEIEHLGVFDAPARR